MSKLKMNTDEYWSIGLQLSFWIKLLISLPFPLLLLIVIVYIFYSELLFWYWNKIAVCIKIELGL